MELEELLEYVNTELSKGDTLTHIAKGLGRNESTIRKRLNKEGYRRDGNKFVRKSDTTNHTTGNTTKIEIPKKGHMPQNTTCSTTEEISKIETNIDMEKLKLLLDNVDNLLRLIPNTTCSTTNISINNESTKVTSLRINEDIYNLVKERATRDNCNISDIVNKSLIDYLNNYL